MSVERIESRDNSTLIHARKVRDGKVPGTMFIEGKRLAEEALSSALEIELCLAADEWAGEALITRCIDRRIPARTLSQKLLRSVADTESPQGIVLLAQRPSFTLDDLSAALRSAQLPLVVYLRGVNNPSNVGAVVRTAEAAGAAGLILSPGSADPYSPKSLRAAMGSSFRLPIVEGRSLSDACKWSAGVGLRTAAAATRGNISYATIDWTLPHLAIFGSEAHGLSAGEISFASETITIPMVPGIESLNLAVSAGVILFEARRQRLLGAG